jgi:hypothetical protein
MLRATAEEVDSLPPVQEVAYLLLGDYPLDDPDWDVGIQEVDALPHYPAYDLEPAPLDYPILYDRIPKRARSRSGARAACTRPTDATSATSTASWSTATSRPPTSSSS